MTTAIKKRVMYCGDRNALCLHNACFNHELKFQSSFDSSSSSAIIMTLGRAPAVLLAVIIYSFPVNGTRLSGDISCAVCPYSSNLARLDELPFSMTMSSLDRPVPLCGPRATKNLRPSAGGHKNQRREPRSKRRASSAVIRKLVSIPSKCLSIIRNRQVSPTE